MVESCLHTLHPPAVAESIVWGLGLCYTLCCINGTDRQLEDLNAAFLFCRMCLRRPASTMLDVATAHVLIRQLLSVDLSPQVNYHGRISACMC